MDVALCAYCKGCKWSGGVEVLEDGITVRMRCSSLAAHILGTKLDKETGRCTFYSPRTHKED